ncbi:hypothetical protein J1N35_015930 [Gossypium stocksii]|uniref:TF-B3 domain-containing protein n=1 Tax=Gossypium stocksii TaxID=47602 RepID=A0A9D3VZD8_9ROSI|nr:hypothetical protein J1N35_015930 [Gossypium stocksii]
MNVDDFKAVTKSDIEKSLLMPTDSFSTFPVPFEGDRFFNVTAVDGTGKAWDFPCFIQQNVRAGDTVFLHRKPMDGGGGELTASAKLKIEVKRKIRLMGEDIWAVLQ